jgi:hypothetical protein
MITKSELLKLEVKSHGRYRNVYDNIKIHIEAGVFRDAV